MRSRQRVVLDKTQLLLWHGEVDVDVALLSLLYRLLLVKVVEYFCRCHDVVLKLLAN